MHNVRKHARLGTQRGTSSIVVRLSSTSHLSPLTHNSEEEKQERVVEGNSTPPFAHSCGRRRGCEWGRPNVITCQPQSEYHSSEKYKNIEGRRGAGEREREIKKGKKGKREKGRKNRKNDTSMGPAYPIFNGITCSK
mmetsp:Transcript_16399/g.41612  ORF Transcript_16399/g.41612 Transcript_16399/m.41612 type:complete len:137 (+) Transcript_16399:193-603(+)